MSRPRCVIAVEINLDLVPGWGYDAEDFRSLIERAVREQVGHYEPTVTVIDPGRIPPKSGAHNGLSPASAPCPHNDSQASSE